MSFDTDSDDDEAAEAHERRIRRCRGCNAKVIFFSHQGRNVPVDEGRVEAEDEAYEPERHGRHQCLKRR